MDVVIMMIIFFVLTFPYVLSASRGEWGHPGVIVWGSSIVSLLCSYYMIYMYGHTMTFETMMLCVIGYLAMLLAVTVSSADRKRPKKIYIDTSVLEMETYKKVLVLMCYVISTILITREVRNIASMMAVSQEVGDIANAYKTIRREGGEGISFFTRKLLNFSREGSYYFMYFMIRQKVHGKWQKSNILLIISMVLFVVQCAFLGGRGSAMAIFFASISFYFIECFRIRKKVNIARIFVIIFVTSCIVFSLFAVTKSFFGRGEWNGLFDYVAYYMGSGIFFLDYFSQHYIEPLTMGRYTFYGIVDFLENSFGTQFSALILPFATVNGTTGNVYTCFYKWYIDFGSIGIFILSFLFITFFIRMYRYCCYRDECATLRVITVFYGSIMEATYLTLYDDHLFNSVNPWIISKFLTLIIIDWVVTTKLTFRRSGGKMASYSRI